MLQGSAHGAQGQGRQTYPRQGVAAGIIASMGIAGMARHAGTCMCAAAAEAHTQLRSARRDRAGTNRTSEALARLRAETSDGVGWRIRGAGGGGARREPIASG